jgi:hypothetical protein
MYQVKKTSPFGRETVVVTLNGRRVGSATIKFVKWMHESIPKRQLRPEQRALVEWYAKSQRTNQLEIA